MVTYIITAFSFLAANFGWFGGTGQTEIFFWCEVIATAAVILIIGGVILFCFLADRSFDGLLAGGAFSLITVVLLSVVPLLCILAAWICTMLWEIDFFLAYQVMCIGSATAGLFRSRNKKD